MDRQRRDILPLETDRPAVARIYAGQEIDQRGLAGAVGTDDRDKFAAPDIEIDAIGGRETSELLPQLFDLQDRLAHAVTSLRFGDGTRSTAFCAGANSVLRPPRPRNTTAIRIGPRMIRQ